MLMILWDHGDGGPPEPPATVITVTHQDFRRRWRRRFSGMSAFLYLFLGRFLGGY